MARMFRKGLTQRNSGDPGGRRQDGSPSPLQRGAMPQTAVADTADYISDMVAELRDLADAADLVFLAYLLDMALEEARAQARKLARGR